MKTRFSRFFCLWLLAFFSVLPLLPVIGGPLFRVVEKKEHSIIFEWNSPSLSWQAIQADGKTYSIPSLGDLALVHNPGKPILPVDAELLEIGDGPVDVSILDSVVVGERAPIICPAPQLHQDANGTISPVYAADATIYQNALYYPSRFLTYSTAVSRGQRLLRLAVHPLRYNPVNSTIRHLRYLRVKVAIEPLPAPGGPIREPSIFNRQLDRMVAEKLGVVSKSRNLRPTESSFQASGWYDANAPHVKLLTVDEGVYAISGADLSALGVDLDGIVPETIRVFNRGVEQARTVDGGEDGRLDNEDRILFYADRLSGDSTFYNTYTDTNVYWLTWGDGTGLRYRSESLPSSAGAVVDTFWQTLHLERDLEYYHGDSDASIHETNDVPGEGWVWVKFILPGNVVNVPFDLPGLAMVGDSVVLRLRLRGTTLAPQTPDHHAQVSVNGQVLADAFFNDREGKIITASAPVSVFRPDGNELEIRSIDTGADRSQFYFDWLEFRYSRHTRARDGWLRIETHSPNVSSSMFVSGFASDSIRIWDLKNQRGFVPTHIAHNWYASIVVRSAGLSDGNFAEFYLNGDLLFSGARGINVVAIQGDSGRVLDRRQFDLYGSAADADSLAAYINKLPDSTVVLAAIRDEGSSQLNEAAYQALERIGSAEIRQVGFRDSWAIIGIKGAEKGSVPEGHRSASAGFVELKQGFFFPQGGDSYSCTFVDTLSDFVVFDRHGLQRPARIVLDQPSQWRSTTNGADYLIITHPAFKDQADRLAAYRQQHNGFRASVVLVQDIYDEFNNGIADPGAIKQFTKYAYENWQAPAPAYLLLFGDASWDPKRNLANSSKYDFVPILGNPVTDVLYACFDGPDDILPEMSVGRLSVETAQQAKIVVDKIIDYENTPSAAWKKNFLFISGGFNRYEQMTFGEQSKRLALDFAAQPPTSGRVLFLNKTGEGLQEGEHRQDILDVLNAGVMWANFIGHAGSRTWDLMFHNPDIDALQNGPRYPFISSMTCHTGRFAEPEQTSFGENFVVNADKGAIAFWGTSGWGYSHEDYLFLRKLYPIVLMDTVQVIGDAINLARIALWNNYGLNPHIRDLVLQYNLLGDPALDLALPRKPDLTILPNDVEVQPLTPSEADSFASVTVRVRNFGLATPDSVRLDLYASNDKRERVPIASGVFLPAIGLIDSAMIKWPLNQWAGLVHLQAEADPENAIDEADEANNTQRVQVQVLSSHIEVITPWTEAVVPATRLEFKVQAPQSLLPQQPSSYRFEVDTTPAFDSPMLLDSGPLYPSGIVIHWRPPQLPAEQLYYWRVIRFNSDDQQEILATSNFYLSSVQAPGWRQGRREQFLGDKMVGLQASNDGVTLAPNHISILLQSAGFNDGNFAVIQINDQAIMNTGRGYNIAVMDEKTGEILETRHFDLYANAANADSMAEFIENLPGQRIVLVVIKDEGSLNMTDRAYAALQKLGSRQAVNIGYRDSFALIGIKNGDSSEVKEVYKSSGQGAAIVSDTLMFYAGEGTLQTGLMGPSQKWRALDWQIEKPESGDIFVDILGKDRRTGKFDTLRSRLSFEQNADLTDLDANRYPYVSLLFHFSTRDGHVTPILRHWQLTADPAPDPAVGLQAFSQSADTVMVGDEVQLQFRLYNIGLSALDSAQVLFEESDPILGRKTFALRSITRSLPEDSFVVVRQTWDSAGKTGLRQLFVTIDPEDRVAELSENNNSLTTNVYVQADSSAPEIKVTFDGREIIYNDLVSNRPLIRAQIIDNSPRPVPDTTSVNVLLDGTRIPFQGSGTHVRLVEEKRGEATIELTPVLSDGSHTLEVLATDASGNRIYHRNDFRVISKLQLINVINYPNPMFGQTDFTFSLTQPADVTIKIYTVAGRLIRTFQPGWLSAGFNTVRWFGHDEDGDEIANGVYVYKIIAKSESEQTEAVNKVMVMR